MFPVTFKVIPLLWGTSISTVYTFPTSTFFEVVSLSAVLEGFDTLISSSDTLNALVKVEDATDLTLKLTSVVCVVFFASTCQSFVLKIFWLTCSNASDLVFSSSTPIVWRPLVIKTFWNFGLSLKSFQRSSPDVVTSNAKFPST